MNRWKKSCCILLSLVLCILSGCAQGDTSSKPQYRPRLIYYTIGNPDPDLSKVNEALNRLLEEKGANYSIDYRKIAWADYGSEITTLIGSGRFDIAFATGKDQGDYLGGAQGGVWLSLDSYLQGSAAELYHAVNPLFWEGARIGGHIYGVPTNKELSAPEWFIFAKDLVEKYNVDITQYQTLESLEPILRAVRDNEPHRIPFRLDSEARNFFALDGYEYVLGKDTPLMIRSLDESPEVVNIFETNEGQRVVHTLRRYYQAGYINEDAALRETTDILGSNSLFCTMGSGGPYSDEVWNSHFGVPVVSNRVSDTVVTTDSARGGMMVVNSKTQHPDECIAFLTLLNTDADVRNLLNYGIEGTHYELNGDRQVVTLSADYAGVQYTQGNWFILNTIAGEPLDKWDIYRKFNDSCTRSVLLGFSPDLTPISAEYEAVSAICQQYLAGIMTGTVDPEVYLPIFNRQLKAAGMDKMQTILQQQVNGWLAQKNR